MTDHMKKNERIEIVKSSYTGNLQIGCGLVFFTSSDFLPIEYVVFTVAGT